MNIKITTDSTCDLSHQVIRDNQIAVIPLSVVMEGKIYKDSVDIVPADIFSHVVRGGELPTTAATNVGEYADFSRPSRRNMMR